MNTSRLDFLYEARKDLREELELSNTVEEESYLYSTIAAYTAEINKLLGLTG